MFRLISKIIALPQTVSSRLPPSLNYATDTMGLGKIKKRAVGKGGGVSTKVKLPVETDTNRLVNYLCGSNILKEGGEDVKLGPDSDYPDWLWDLHIGELHVFLSNRNRLALMFAGDDSGVDSCIKTHKNDSPPLKLEDLDPSTLKYWAKVRASHRSKRNKLAKLRQYPGPMKKLY